jgi:hypothetical protein
MALEAAERYASGEFDRIPLVIELSAARVRVLAPGRFAAVLSNRRERSDQEAAGPTLSAGTRGTTISPEMIRSRMVSISERMSSMNPPL